MKVKSSKLKVQKMPDKTGHFGIYGGRYISETLMPVILEFEKTYKPFKQGGAS